MSQESPNPELDNPGSPSAEPRNLTSMHTEPADERELLADIKHWRSGRATRKLSEAFSHAYIVIFAIAMFGAMVANVVVQAQVSVSQCTDPTCLSARTVLPWASVAFAVAVALGMSRLFGPVLASAAEGFWLMDAPLRRGQLLKTRLYAVVAVSALVGTVLGGLVSALSGSAPWAIAAWAAAAGLAGGGSVAFAAAQQSRGDSPLVRWLGALFSLVTLAALVLVVAIAAGWIQPRDVGDTSLLIAIVVAAVGAIALVLALIIARLRLDRLPRQRLTSGGSLVSGLSGAMYALDIGLMNDILTERRCQEIGNVRSRHGHGQGLSSIAWRDLQRLRRFPRPLLPVVVTVLVPYVLDALGLAVIAPPVAAIALFGSVIPLLGGLRVFSRSGGMGRSLPFAPGQIKRASIIVPAVVCVLWSLATAPAYIGFGGEAAVRSIPEAMIVAEVVAAAGLLGAIRWTVAKPINFSAPMVSTGAGAMPPGMITNLFRGFDICLLITVPLVFNLPWFVSVILAAICAAVLLSSFNMAEMQHKAKQQQAEMERLKTGRGPFN